MQVVQLNEPRRAGVGSGVLAVGFGTTVAMWFVAYFGRLPALLLPGPLLLPLMLLCLFAGGLFLGRHIRRGASAGAAAGVLSGTLNLLILGSFVGGAEAGQLVPSALWWVPGWLLLSAGVAACGAEAGTRWMPSSEPFADWPSAFVRVAVAATLLLLAVGGVVTSAEAGLAVDDWPTSFGYNMFLYPFSKMTGGVYYEHAHRLFGALVGLTTLVLAFLLQVKEPRRWVRLLGWSAVLLVVIQGTLGGLRVTERNLGLAMIHGVLAQLFFAGLVGLGAFTSKTWRGDRAPLRRASAAGDRVLGIVLVSVVIGQLVLGAAQRHFDALLIVHMVIGVAAVAPLAVHVGFRGWGMNEGQPILQRLGLALVGLIGLQILLGFSAYGVKGAVAAGALAPGFDLTVTTVHQWVGAVILGTAVLSACWGFRLLRAGGARPRERKSIETALDSRADRVADRLSAGNVSGS